VDGIAARVFAHKTLEELARHASIPVINALSDLEHPCQAMADLYTLWERGMELKGLELAWIGDGNNVLTSLLFLCALTGVKVRAACPPGYEPAAAVLEACRALGGLVRVTTDAREAAEGADVIYTDVWISMGQEAEREKRLEAFQRYQVNDTLLGFASPGALVMHCLPAHRGDEITDAVLDGPSSIVLDQAENRLHVQKGIVMHLSGAA
jgi:ornithine carbamoyltransferase